MSHPLEELLQPRSIAVVGASNNPHSAGNNFTAALLKYGFRGKIFPINPNYPEILGLKAYPAVKAVPDPVDYVISAVSAPLVPSLLEDCGQKGVKLVHLFTARFSETGRPEAAELEQNILRLAKKWNIRLIGPNCMGLFYPGQGISFSDAMPEEKAGPIGLISQSGQAVEEIVRSAAVMGLYFSKAISYGNALDFNECDFLEFLAQDPETRIILMYLEGLRDGRRFLQSLRQASAKKPVVILKGGRGRSGARAVASHTASLAGSSEVLSTALTQTGAVSVSSPEELIDLALLFHYLPPFTGLRVGVLGGAGGASVLAADQCEAAGLEVIPIPPGLRQALKDKGVSIWDWIGNPVDHSIREGDDFKPRQMLTMMAQDPHFDLLLVMFGEPHHERQRGISADDYLEEYRLEECRDKPILSVVPDRCLGIDHYDDWNWKVIYEIRTKLLKRGLPFFPSI
ncbi:MAG: CoA-binding protein, partial [Thermodesulfobacteriota bacterium]